MRERYPGMLIYGDGIAQAQTLPGPPADDYLRYQWALAGPPVVAGGANVTGAWATATGKGIIVAVLDTGIRTESGEFAGRVLPGFDMGSDLVRSNDGDGRDGDASDPGDYTDDASSSWHGTHVAGIALAG